MQYSINFNNNIQDFPMVHLDGEIKNLSNKILVETKNKNFKVFIPDEK